MQPDALDIIDRLRDARERAGSLLLGLDFDGTLAPIVPRPEEAALAPALRTVLEALVARADTHVALVSGRGMHDLARRVHIDGVYYAGNHGLEIEGPDVRQVHAEAAAAQDRLGALARSLEQAFADHDGVLVEDKGLTLSVHFRLVQDPAEAARVQDTVHTCGADVAGIRMTDGKKVVEIRPDVDWDKGSALQFLRTTIERQHGRAPAVFIGDDRTDEDAFRVLGADDFPIYVGDSPPPGTAARAFLKSTADVASFLTGLT